MEKELMIEAPTIELARKKLQRKIPEGFYLLSAIETPPQKGYIAHTGQSAEEALKNAAPDLKKNQAKIHQSSPQKEITIRSYAPNAEEACRHQNICNSNHGLKLIPDFQVNSVKLIKKGDRISLFSLKRNHHQYEVKITEPPCVEVCYLTNAIIDAEITDDRDEARSMLLHSAKTGDLPLVENLLRCGGDINATDFKGKNALFYATENDHIDLALFLIDKGIDIFKKDNNGNGVLSIENAGTWNDRLVSRLVEKGLKKPDFLFEDYCPKCKQRVETYEEDLYSLDDGWITRIGIKCKTCESVVREETRQT